MATYDDKTVSDGIQEKLIAVNRTAKVVKGGRVFGFSALVVVGNGDGRVGFGFGKAREVPSAIKKAMENARASMITVRLNDKTLQYKIHSRLGAAKVMMQPAPKGTGIIAGTAMRAVFEMVGVENVVAKSLGSNSAINVVRATIAGLKSMRSVEEVAHMRGKSVDEVLENER